jgi:hypothetical protein
MSIRVIPIHDGFALEQRTEAGMRFLHVPEAEVGQLLEDLLNAAIGSQIAGAPFDPQVSRVADTMDSYRLEDEL